MAESKTAGRRAERVPTEEVIDWLTDQTVTGASVPDIVAGCCERLTTAGIPLWRLHLSYTTLHPLFGSQGATWLRDRGLQTEAYEHRTVDRERWLQSPLRHMLDRRIPMLRRKLAGPHALIDFPVLAELRAAGATDYLAFLIPFCEIANSGIMGSWATDRPRGFGDGDVSALGRVQRFLAVACKMAITTEISRNVAGAYLGRTAGRKVLEGSIRRGDRETIHAVIWLSDLRDSTRLADELASDEYLSALNRYFECTAQPLIDAGGEVLSFIGDAVLGIFPLGDGGQSVHDACERAVAAAHAAVEHARRGGNAAKFGIALHRGDVIFGNIGVPDRLAFSVVGQAVNEVARIEALTKTLNRPVLATDRVAETLDLDWEPLGPHALRGIGRPIEVFALPIAGEI